jgi:hypothetical protein
MVPEIGLGNLFFEIMANGFGAERESGSTIDCYLGTAI